MEQILELFFGNPDYNLTYGIGPLAGVAVSAASSLLGGIFGSGKAKKRARAAARRQAEAQRKLNAAEQSRQAVINPYSDIKSTADMAKDLSSMLSNPYANLGVATQAAEIQAEQTDIALANTLDTLRATGSGAGGATALAQAALKSKQGVAASIEQQEAKNEQLKAQGEATLQSQRMAEQQRLQGIQMSEAQRVQAAQAQGKAFEFNAREQREVSKLNRLSAQVQNAEQQKASAQQAQAAAWSGAISGIGSAIGAGITGDAFKGK
tara:strand:- start:795 stop:1589 length:795 start_codon:yes stop_codon:yes gene_type:complete